jgi:ribosomal protein L23
MVVKNKNSSTDDFQLMLGAVKYPVITDKATRLLEQNKYTFMVDRKANKATIKK